MELTPDQKYAMDSMDRRSNYLFISIVNAVCLLLALGLLVITKSMIITFMFIIVISSFNTWRAAKRAKEEDANFTSVSDNRLELKDGYIHCYQAAEDVFEECIIYMEDIQSIVESSARGFYIYLNENSKRSSILIDRTRTSAKIFYVNGFGYKLKDFVNFFNRLINEAPQADVQATMEHKGWFYPKEKQVFKEFLVPWLFLIAMIVVHIFSYFIM